MQPVLLEAPLNKGRARATYYEMQVCGTLLGDCGQSAVMENCGHCSSSLQCKLVSIYTTCFCLQHTVHYYNKVYLLVSNDLRMNIDYLPERCKLTDIYNGNTMFPVRREVIFMYVFGWSSCSEDLMYFWKSENNKRYFRTLGTRSGPPLWSSGQSSWLQIQRSGFDCRRYQIFWEVVGLERGPLSLVSTVEKLLEDKSSSSGLEILEYGRRDPSRTLYP
jgi:hypothetical protein